MIYLSGHHGAEVAAAARDGWRLGLINTPESAYAPEVVSGYRWWAADNGCWSQGAAFRLDRFLRWLDRQPRPGCLFVVAPDVPMDAARTLERFWAASVEIRRLGFPVALAAQNGLELLGAPWPLLDALFIGGDDGWKLGHEAARIAHRAELEGKWVHMGRVNSRRRLERAVAIGCDSADGTFLRWPRANLPRVARWFRDLSGQSELLDRTD